jgi:hypothetical protein
MPYHDEYEDRFGDTYRRPREGPLDPFADDDLSWKHSRLGIASFCLAIAGGMIAFVMLVVAGILESSTPGLMDGDSPESMMVGAGFIGAGLVLLIGVGLGIGGLCESRRKKVFATLGLVLNILALLGIGVLMVIGLMSTD